MNCPKAPHLPQHGWYGHDENDDTPYDVDGVLYCGRCHYACGANGRCEHPDTTRARQSDL